MTEPLQPFPHFIHFLEQMELCADRCAWSFVRVRGELRGERRQRIQDAHNEAYQLLCKATRFFDYLAQQHIITSDGADRLASLLLTSAREVIRENQRAEAWGWAPKHGRRAEAEKLWKQVQPRRTIAWPSVSEAVALLMKQQEASCGKH